MSNAGVDNITWHKRLHIVFHTKLLCFSSGKNCQGLSVFCNNVGDCKADRVINAGNEGNIPNCAFFYAKGALLSGNDPLHGGHVNIKIVFKITKGGSGFQNCLFFCRLIQQSGIFDCFEIFGAFKHNALGEKFVHKLSPVPFLTYI